MRGFAAFCASMLLAWTLCVPAQAQHTADLQMLGASDGVAVAGYDPVAYFLDGQALHGRGDIALIWRGMRWHFSSEENRATFEANPRAYAPQFGGLCVFALSEGRVVVGDPHHFVIHEGQLYLLEGPDQRDRLNADPSALLGLARTHWPDAISTPR